MHKSVPVELARRAGEPDSGGGELQHSEARHRDVQDHVLPPGDGCEERGVQPQGVLSGPEHRGDQDQLRDPDGAAQARAGAEADQHPGQHSAVQVTALSVIHIVLFTA